MVRKDVDKPRSGTNFLSLAKTKSDDIAILNALTPVEERGGLLFKRDDLFRPFETKVLNGGKLRQVITVLRACRRRGVITAASIHSPQIPLVAGAAHHLGLRCVAVVGGTSVTTELDMARRLGAEIKRSASGRHRALFAEVARVNSTLDYYVVPYGVVSPSDPAACFMTQAQQAANLPDELDTLVVTCGSGMSTLGILTGLWRFSKRVNEVVLVTTAPSRSETISNFVRAAEPAARSFLGSVKLTYIDLFGLPGFRYERRVPYTLCGIHLHPRYEAKAFRHVLQRRDCSSKRTLFWIIGADLREPDTGEVT
jgi:1-aminocyclopropane-1-carboxylate deaminase/D-cysteine desulfhydrase-like pyridoxal-dependent ACC family enzyme